MVSVPNPKKEHEEIMEESVCFHISRTIKEETHERYNTVNSSIAISPLDMICVYGYYMQTQLNRGYRGMFDIYNPLDFSNQGIIQVYIMTCTCINKNSLKIYCRKEQTDIVDYIARNFEQNTCRKSTTNILATTLCDLYIAISQEAAIDLN